MSSLKNKVAVITGGNSGMGFATAKEFIAQGAKVVITGKNQLAIDEAIQELGNDTIGILSNAVSITDTERLVEKVKSMYGKVDILFINAGVGTFSPIAYTTEEQFDATMNVNFKGAYFTLNKFIPVLSSGASVIFLSSINANTGMPNSSVYAASKAAVNALVNIAAIELAPENIRVNTVSPGPIQTPMFGKVGLDEASLQGMAVALQTRVPAKRIGTPEEVAKLVSFLASDDASFITGSNYVIDGGVSINQILG